MRDSGRSPDSSSSGLERAASLSPESGLPAYLAIRDRIAALIHDGDFSPGAKLPPARTIAEHFGVSVATAGRAIAFLERDSLVVTRSRSGTFVAETTGSAPEYEICLCVHPALLMNRDHEFAFRRLQGMITAAQQNGAGIHPITTGEDFDPNAFAGGKAGVVFFDANYKIDGFADIAAYVTENNIPACAAVHCEDPIVSANDMHVPGFELATEHLLNLGHRRIALINHMSFPAHGSLCVATRNRDGYLRAFRRRQARPPADLYVAAPAGDDSRFVEETEKAVEKLLRQTPRPTAIVCNNDPRALLVMELLADRGLRVPEDLSVVGFDNRRAAETSDPPLTTVDPQRWARGAASVRYVLDQLRGRDGPFQEIRPMLVKRRSTCAPGERRAVSDARRGSAARTDAPALRGARRKRREAYDALSVVMVAEDLGLYAD